MQKPHLVSCVAGVGAKLAVPCCLLAGVRITSMDREADQEKSTAGLLMDDDNYSDKGSGRAALRTC